MLPKIYFDSLTGNVRRFVERLPFEAVCISEAPTVDSPFIFVTYTTGFGNVPPASVEFLLKYGDYLVGVASSGNRNWGENFGKAANHISDAFDVPILLKFELSGTNNDIKILTEKVAILWQNGRN